MKKQVLILAALLVIAGLYASAQVSKADTTSLANTVCPAGYICVKTKPVCPTGYICTPNTTNSSFMNMQTSATVSSSGYVPGSWTSTVLLENSTSSRAIIAAPSTLQNRTASATTYSSSTLQSIGVSDASKLSSYVISNLIQHKDSIWQNGTDLPWTSYKTTSNNTEVTICRYPVTDNFARALQSVLQARGVNADFLTSDSNLYVAWDDRILNYFSYQQQVKNGFANNNTQFPRSMIARCLDAGYVSNYPAWASHFTSTTSR